MQKATLQPNRYVLWIGLGSSALICAVAAGVGWYGTVSTEVATVTRENIVLRAGSSPRRMLPPLGSGLLAAFVALGSGWGVSRMWERTLGLMTLSASRLADGDHSVEFGEFTKFPEIRALSLALQKLLEAREQQSRELRESLREFVGTFENVAIGVFHLNQNGRFHRVNQHVCEIVGVVREELLRRNFQQMIFSDDRSFVWGKIQSLFEGKLQSLSIEKRCLHDSGFPIWVQLTATIMKCEQGTPAYVIVFIEDISTRRNTEENLLRSEASWNSLMDCSSDSCVAVLDLSGCVLSLNPVGRALLNVEVEKADIGDPWSAFWTPNETASLASAIGTAKENRVGRFCAQKADLTGLLSWWEVTVTAIPGPAGKPERLLSVARDVTSQHIAAEALKRAKESAEAASRAKDDLLSALSHELRTPLNPVLLLAGEYARSNDVSPRMREDFALIHRNVRLEARLIDDLLDLTKIQRAGLSLSTRLLDLGSLLTQVCDAARGDACEKNVTLELQKPESKVFVRGDTTRLHQVFSNLIVNAVKFSASGGTVRLGIKEEGGLAKVSVSDDGIGISADEVSRIFEPFAQGAHAREPNRFGGLGLGLAIARMLMERHRGRIWVESAGRGCGSTFFAELPVDLAGVSETAPVLPGTEHKRTEVRSRQILLVEDHEATRITLARMLGRRGHTVTQAACLQAAVACVKERTFDVLISDIGLPDGNGGDLIREHGDRFIDGGIALSGFGMEAEVAKSLQSGFRRHLTKPIEVETLEDVLNALDMPATAGKS